MSDVEQRSDLLTLTTNYRAIVELVERNGGEISDESAQALEEALSALTSKADACYFVLSRIANEADWYIKEAARLKHFAEIMIKAHDRLKEKIVEAIKAGGEIQGETALLKLKSNPPSVLIKDEELLPDVYKTTVVTQKPDKKRIKEDLTAGVPVPGAELQQTQSLYIGRPKK